MTPPDDPSANDDAPREGGAERRPEGDLENAVENDLEVGASPDDPAAAGDLPDFAAARQHVLTELLRFSARLRAEGADVPTAGALEAARALAVVGLGDETRVEAALRATLVSGADDLDAFEGAFPAFWQRLRSGLDRIATASDGPDVDADARGPTDGTATDDDATDEDATADASAAPMLEDADPATITTGASDGDVRVRLPTDRRHVTGDRPVAGGGEGARRYSAVGGREPVDVDPAPLASGDLAAIDRFVDALATLGGRRTEPAPTGGLIDGRRALRASLATGGAPIELPTATPQRTALQCCLLIDVSGSVLDTIDRRVLLAFAERVVETARRASVFLFDTELVEATAQFERAEGDPAASLRAAEIQWGGGTRLGAAFETLRRRHPGAVDRRTVVVVVSDGLDVGEADRLEAGMTWLSTRARAIVWLNPLAASPSYEPTARGMATCRPYVDGLFGFAVPTDLAEAARQIERRGVTGPIGYEHDERHRATGRTTTVGGRSR